MLTRTAAAGPRRSAWKTTPVRVVGPFLLIGFACLLQIQAPRALLNVLWRVADLSFDDPAMQALDELASETPPYAEPFTEAQASVRCPSEVSGPVHEQERFPTARRFILSSGITRGPPLV